MNAPNVPASDPRAEALLGGDHIARLGFRALVALTAKPRTLAALARRLDVSRQAIYRALSAARAAGYGPELDALPKLRAAYGEGVTAAKAACQCPLAEGRKTRRHVGDCPLRAHYQAWNAKSAMGATS